MLKSVQFVYLMFCFTFLILWQVIISVIGDTFKLFGFNLLAMMVYRFGTWGLYQADALLGFNAMLDED